jgi:hypothetical protein
MMTADVHTPFSLSSRVQPTLNLPELTRLSNPVRKDPISPLPFPGKPWRLRERPARVPGESSARANLQKTMNLTNEAILALLLELKAELAELRREVAALKATDAVVLDKIEVLDNKLNFLAEEMGMI